MDITFLAKGEKKMVTFRQLEILFGFTMEKVTYGTSRKKNSKEYGLQSLKRGTLPQGPRLLRSGAQCPQGSCQHLLCKESHWTINEGEVKLLDMGIKPIISRTRMGRRSEEIGHTQGTHASP
ncbi:unnamed protein product [Microthlaspi erraticum]|uniref:Uncharacterized protein n=1 Tax=Microthlaspi erraticum TaxID=1685480 RepID=A0A6D2IY62_9BRAS|nr:unnamed protein product [Microthlaspi erraticum]